MVGPDPFAKAARYITRPMAMSAQPAIITLPS
jgi:hypothetical protein